MLLPRGAGVEGLSSALQSGVAQVGLWLSLQRPGLVVGEEGEEEWPVEKILDRKQVGRGWSYLVRWRGYGPDVDDWIPSVEARNLECFGDWLAENEPDLLTQWKKDMKLDKGEEGR